MKKKIIKKINVKKWFKTLLHIAIVIFLQTSGKSFEKIIFIFFQIIISTEQLRQQNVRAKSLNKTLGVEQEIMNSIELEKIRKKIILL